MVNGADIDGVTVDGDGRLGLTGRR